MKYLVIVESPSKCKKIEKYLNDNNDLHIYEVVATMGHITSLPSLNHIDFENNFACTYELIESKKKNTEIIHKKIKDFDDVIICSDPDREGEGIAAAICQTFKLDIKTTKRVTFQEITETAIVNAMKNPRTIDMNLVHAQQARQILDLIVGYKVSPVLWKFITKHAAKSLSAGRCQTPALKLIYENAQENKIQQTSKIYKTIGYFTHLNIPFDLNKQFTTEEEVIDFLDGSADFSHKYSYSDPVQVYKQPPEPFTTSRIQQVASNELHYSPKETMQICQNLYEAGYITYMRTDSKVYSNEFIDTVKEYVLRNYPEGEKYINGDLTQKTNPKTNPKTKKAAKVATHLTQDAHEAIRPTNISLYELPDKVDSKEKRLYKLIWTTTLESCLCSAVFLAFQASISGYNNTQFSYTSEQIVFPGWLIVSKKYQADTKEYNFLQMIKQNDILPYKKMTSKFSLKGLKQHYTEARLVQLLEEKGIGRPSTFSSLVDKIQDRGYVKKQDIKGEIINGKDYELMDGDIMEEMATREFGNEKRKLIIQPLGIIVIEFLDKHFLSLFNYNYTKNLEDDLDKIAKGEKVWYDLCCECNLEIDTLINGLKSEHKMEIAIDDSHSYIVGKYGPVIKHVETMNGKEEITFKPVNKNIDIHQIERGELLLENIIDTTVKKKQYILGKHNDVDVILKKGQYGLYITWGDNSKPLKDFGNRPIENITFDEVKQYLEEGGNFIREITPTMSIRKSVKGDYLFVKTPKMKKPQFFDLKGFYKETKEDYKTCNLTLLKTWVKNTYEIY
jgi:DNA topoisomerase-1